jgi:exodeoxyribonuclease-5
MNFTPESLTEHLLDLLKLSPTGDQYKAFHFFSHYFLNPRHRSVFLLKGSAGTGKTTLLTTLTHFLRQEKIPVVLMAPTGRAAKVISRKTKRSARTLHRHIYKTTETSMGVFYSLAPNEDAKGTVYIVDEASMLGEGEGSSLLKDLLSFVFTDHPEAMLIFSGDEAQLPPVGSDISPALDMSYLTENHNLKVTEVVMRAVKRQALDSGILLNANKVRKALDMAEPRVSLFINHEDVRIVENKSDALEEFSSRYDPDRQDKVVLITFSNYWANMFNKAYRSMIYEDTFLPQVNDRIMVVRNNYSWANREIPFLANGETGVIRRIYLDTLEERYGLRWMDVDIEFENLKGEPVEQYGKIVLNLLDSPEPTVSWEVWSAMIKRRKKDAGLEDATGGKDPYTTALQIKYAYAVTGHKSQGGQWEDVIVAFEPLYPHLSMRDYLRWAYTAMTRAEKRLFLLDCPFLESIGEVECYRKDFVFQPEMLEKGDYFSEGEKKLLLEIGPSLIRLLNGQLPVNTPAREHLIKVVNKEEAPRDEIAATLLKWVELEEKEP